MTAGRAASLGLAVALCSCSVLLAVSDDVASGGRDGGDRDDAGEGADAPNETGIVCPVGKPGPALVPAESFCIDATEVSIAMYAAFLAADKSAVPSHPDCVNSAGSTPLPDAATPEHPVLVRWCDAFAYCHWAGKRLCGVVGDGGAFSIAVGVGGSSDSLLNRGTNEWLSACVGGASANTYPYGNDPIRDACAPAQAGTPGELTSYAGLTPIGTHPACEGGYPGIFDMGGNAQEWINAQLLTSRFVDGASVPHRPFYAMGTGETCRTVAGPLEGNDERHGYGIRCCWSP